MEFETNNSEVAETFGKFVYDYVWPISKSHTDVSGDLAAMLRVRFKVNGSKRSPKVILMGPPGSGRSTQSEEISKLFGLVNVSVQKLADEEAKKNPAIKERIRQCLDAGEDIPDDISIRIVRDRITQADCRVNGFVLDGFPQSESQINLLKSLNIKPTLACTFDLHQDDCVQRLKDKRVDPLTGEYFNLDVANLQPNTDS